MHALASVTPDKTVSKRRLLMYALFRSQFSALVWMYHSRTLNNKINRVHRRCHSITYKDNLSSFQNLLDQDRSVSLHTCNQQTLAIEMYKVSKRIAPTIFADTFGCNSCENYNLPYQSEFSRLLIKIGINETEIISCLGPRIWDLVPQEMKQKESLTALKRPLTLGNHMIVRVGCNKNMFLAFDLRYDFLVLFNVFLETP